MARYVAFLRAVNLGPTRRVPMADLRGVFEGELHWAVRRGGRANVTVKDKDLDRALGGIEGTNRSPTMLRKLLERLSSRRPARRCRRGSGGGTAARR